MPLAKIIDNDGNVIEITTLAGVADNLDGMKGLVTASLLYARSSDGTAKPPKMAYSNADNEIETNYGLHSRSHNYGLDVGGNWDRFKCKVSDGSDINNSTIGCQIVINLNYVWDSANSKWVPMTQP